MAGVVLSGLNFVASRVDKSASGLTFHTDVVSYPADPGRVSPDNKHLDVLTARFLSPGAFEDTETMFAIQGDFSCSDQPVTNTNRTMAFVSFEILQTTTYALSALDFTAQAVKTAVGTGTFGTADDPRIRFSCTGRFDPVGVGDAVYDVLLEIDQSGQLHIVHMRITSGTGTIQLGQNGGFELIV